MPGHLLRGLVLVLVASLTGCAAVQAPAVRPAWVIPHRGSALTMPENGLAAFTAAVEQGADALEFDVHLTADGVPVVMHDADTGRTATPARAVASLQSTEWTNMRLDPQRWLGPGYAAEAPPLLRTVVERFGRRAILLPEAKATGAGRAIVEVARSAGLRPADMIVQSFMPAELVPVTAAGYGAMLLVGDARAVTDWVALASRGIRYVGVANVSPESAKQAALHGVTVVRWTVNRRVDLRASLAAGAVGVMTDDWSYLSSTAATASRDTWATGRWMPGMVPSGAGVRGALAGDGWWRFPSTAEQYQGVLQGWASPVVPREGRQVVEVDVRMDAVLEPTRWASVMIGAEDDTAFNDLPGDAVAGYHLLLRQNGQLAIFRKPLGEAPTLGAALDTAPVPLGAVVRMRAELTPGQVRWTRLDAGESVVLEDAAWRGGYLHLGRHGAAVSFRHMVVR